MSDPKNMNEDSYIIFSIGGELYGTQLLSVKEIIEPQKAKPIPCAPAYYLGLMNLRGQIISVIDLHQKFAVPRIDTLTGLIMILDLEGSVIGVLVGKVLGVKKLGSQAITYHPVVDGPIGAGFILGAIRMDEKLVTLVDLKRLIDQSELARHREAA